MNKKIILILFFIFLLTGCYDNKELNEIAILTATEINKVDDQYIVKSQVVNPQAPDKTTITQSPFIIYTGKGKTIQEAYRNTTTESPKFLYSNHMQILIINEKIAKENISEVIDFYIRNPAIRTDFYVLIGKNENILDIITPIESLSSSSIKETLENNKKYLGSSATVTFDEFVNMYLNKNLEIALPSIEIINHDEEGEKLENTEESQVKSKYKLGNIAIFKDNKLQGYLTKDESITYNILKNNIQNTILTYECEDKKYITIEIIKSSASTKITNKEITIDINMSGNINESHCNIDIKEKDNIRKIEKLFENKLEESIQKDINNIRNNYNSDIFNFLDTIYKYDYNTYQNIKNNWYEETYKKIKVNINTNISIITKGNILEVIDEKN